VKPWELLGEARTPDGSLMALMRRDREHVILADGKPLMSSLMHGSEEALAALACEGARGTPQPCVLVGGLGMGFTLRATLDALPADAAVFVSELLTAVVEWNRGPLALLAGEPLKDRRVTVLLDDVAAVMKGSAGRFDVMLLDVDNGPSAFTESANAGLYTDQGLASARAALKPGGVLAVWSAWDDRKFEQRLRYNGFRVEVTRVRARLKKGGPRHTIFIGHVDGRARL
jgi:spermidine synthase